MILNVTATYQPDADEVLVDFRSTQDDGITTSVADRVVVTLYSQTKDSVGTKSQHSLSEIKTTSDYLQAEQNYVLKFRHPKVRADLLVRIQAQYGANNFEKIVSVGEVETAQATMDLPDNILYTRDPFDYALTQGSFEIPNDNQIVLAPEIQEYVTVYDYTVANPVEDYMPLTYSGGGNRLFMSNQTNSFSLQSVDTAPWVNSSYAFMENGATNLLPNSFFNNVTSGVPNGYAVDAAGAMLMQSVDTDYQTANGAKLWSLRFRQTNSVSAFNQVSLSISNPVAITGGNNYTFSSYLRIQAMTSLTKVTKVTMGVKWFDNSTQLSESSVDLAGADFKSLSLAIFSGLAPSAATHAQPFIKVGSLDFGDDVLLTVFAPQLEIGLFATSRTQGSRIQDAIVIPDYNASNQKTRFEMIAGFNSGHPVSITTGPVWVSFTSGSTLRVEIPSQGFVEAPVSFSAGDLVDFTIEHSSSNLVKVYLSGNLVAQQPLPSFVATPAPLSITGAGFELLRLSVFSRK